MPVSSASQPSGGKAVVAGGHFSGNVGADEKGCVMCGEPGKPCGACLTVMYCGKDHQKQDWKLHKAMCGRLRPAHDEKYGNHLVACKDLAKGTVVLEERPLCAWPVFEPSTEGLEGEGSDKPPSMKCFCVQCFRATDDTRKCAAGCGWPVCGDGCPGDRTMHTQAECTHARLPRQGWQVGYVTRSVVLGAFRCLLLKATAPHLYDRILRLQSHASELRAQSPTFVSSCLLLLRSLLPGSAREERDSDDEDDDIEDEGHAGMGYSDEEIEHTVGVCIVNGFSVPTGECAGNPWDCATTGAALFPQASLFTHDCRPNARVRHGDAAGGFVVSVELLRDVRQGERLSISYAPSEAHTRERRRVYAHLPPQITALAPQPGLVGRLRASKFFDCCCPRCADPSEAGLELGSLVCPQCSKDVCASKASKQGKGSKTPGYLRPQAPLEDGSAYVCGKCGKKEKAAYVQQVEAAASKALECCLADGLDSAVDTLEKFIEEYEGRVLHPGHYLLHQAHLQLLHLYREVQAADEAQLGTLDGMAKKRVMARLARLRDKVIDVGGATVATLTKLRQTGSEPTTGCIAAQVGLALAARARGMGTTTERDQDKAQAIVMLEKAQEGLASCALVTGQRRERERVEQYLKMLQ